MKKQILTTPGGESYPILTGSGLINTCGQEISSIVKACRVMIVSDTNVAPLYLETVKNDNRRAYPIKGETLAQLCQEYIDKDIPVMTWVTTYMEESYERLSWIVDYVDENAECKVGDTTAWRQNEHCMVLIGYTDKEYIFCDSVAGKVVAHDKQLAETRFKEIGNQAVVVK